LRRKEKTKSRKRINADALISSPFLLAIFAKSVMTLEEENERRLCVEKNDEQFPFLLRRIT